MEFFEKAIDYLRTILTSWKQTVFLFCHFYIINKPCRDSRFLVQTVLHPSTHKHSLVTIQFNRPHNLDGKFFQIPLLRVDIYQEQLLYLTAAIKMVRVNRLLCSLSSILIPNSEQCRTWSLPSKFPTNIPKTMPQGTSQCITCKVLRLTTPTPT